MRHGLLVNLSALLLVAACVRSTATAPARPAAPDPGASPVAIALTFDDLPYQTRRGGVAAEPDPAAWDQTTDRILAALAAAKAPATVFVNCGNLAEEDRLVARWRAAGHAIGNHTAHHRSAADGDLDEWVGDLAACGDLWPPGATETRWFRFPFLWRGETVERREAVAAAIADAGYITVPVTIDTHDWLFEVHRRRLDDPAKVATLGDRLVDNVADAVAEARAISREKLGREAPQILLLHMNALTAGRLPDLLARLMEDGLLAAPLAEVMADPLYAEADAWAGRGSRMWLARTAPVERPDGRPWYGDREGALSEELAADYGPLR